MACEPMPSDLPPLYALQAFIAAARLGSLTSAADQLHLTQGAVSRQVQLLEDHFGCPLFVRHARGLSLTAEGKELLPEVVEALESLARASARVKRSMGELSVQLPPTFSLLWFLPRLPLLNTALPNLDVRVATHWSAGPDFSRADVDAIIAHGNGAWTNVQAVLLLNETLTPYCAPAIAARLDSAADLVHQTLLHASRDRGEWLAWLRGNGLDALHFEREQMFDTVNMCLEAARRGQGVAIADPLLVSPVAEDPPLVTPFESRVESGNGYYLTYPPERAEQTKIVAFQGWILEQASRSVKEGR